MGRRPTPPAGRPWTLIEADTFQALPKLAARSVDAVVTDPPYGIDFGGERWDGRDIRATFDRLPAGEAFERWTSLWAAECLRVLKPGGHLIAFGSPRTAHRLAAGIEDAGFELRDQLMWLYGSGVPKARLRDGRASQLKPGYEPIVLARAPLTGGTLAANEAAWGTGQLGIDEARLTPDTPGALGRWPANVALTHTIDCATVCAPGCPVLQLDRAGSAVPASRFFYCPKPSRRERDSGCHHLPARKAAVYNTSAARPRRNTHPTVKPVALMAWLIRLACPPTGVVLDPFTGSGTTGVAALQEQRRFIGIEREPRYGRIARARLRHATPHAGTRAPGSGRG